MEWHKVKRPGFFRDKRDQIYEELDTKYGKGNWKIGWLWGSEVLDFEREFKIYEDAYYADSFNREEAWRT